MSTPLDDPAYHLPVLPDNVLLHIFGFLSPRELVSPGEVSKSFRQIAKIVWRNLKAVDFEVVLPANCSPAVAVKVHAWILNQCWGKIREIKNLGYGTPKGFTYNLELQAPHLTHFHVTNVDSECFSVFASLPNLEYLKWNKLVVTEEESPGFNQNLISLVNLKTLNLDNAKLSCDLTMPPNIQEIYVKDFELARNNAGCFPFSLFNTPLSSLEILQIDNCYFHWSLEGSDLHRQSLNLCKVLESFPKLKQLYLNHCEKVSKIQGMGYLQYMCLDALTITRCFIVDEDMEKDWKLPVTLKKLQLDDFSKITNNLPQLEELYSRHGVGNPILLPQLMTAAFKHTPNLQKLTLIKYWWSSIGLQTIASLLPALNYLDISSCRIDWPDLYNFVGIMAGLHVGLNLQNNTFTINFTLVDDLNGYSLKDGANYLQNVSNLKSVIPSLLWIDDYYYSIPRSPPPFSVHPTA